MEPATKADLKEQAERRGIEFDVPMPGEREQHGGDEASQGPEEDVDTGKKIVSRGPNGQPELLDVPLLYHPNRDGRVKIKPFTAKQQYKYSIRQHDFREEYEDGEYEKKGEVLVDDDNIPVGLYFDEGGDYSVISFAMIAEVLNNHFEEPDLGRLDRDSVLELPQMLLQAYWMTISVYGSGMDPDADTSRPKSKKKS